MSTFENEDQNQPITAPPEPEPAEEVWQGPSQEEWQQTQQALQSLTPLAEMYQQYEQQGQYPEPQAQPQVQVDPFADNYPDQLQQIIDQRIQEATAPLNDLYSQVQYEQLEEQARDILGDYKQANDIEFRGKGADDWVLAQADKLASQMAEQYGPGVKAAEAAIAAAANSLRDYETAVAEAAIEQNNNQLQTLSGAPRQPDTAGAASVQSLAAPTGGPHAVWEKYYGGLR